MTAPRNFNPIQPEETFGSVEIAKILQASPSSVQRWIDKKLIPSFRTPGGHRRVLGRDLLQFIALRGMEPYAEKNRADVIGIDDDPQILAILKAMVSDLRPDLSWLGVTRSFDAGLQVMRHRPSLVFLDIEMPGVDGRDICRMIKLSPELDRTKVVVVTGHAAPTVLESAKASGADDVLIKPITLGAVETHLAAVPAPMGKLANG